MTRPTVPERASYVQNMFTRIAKREGFPIGEPLEYDYTQYQHQVPGGMISNLRHQLRKVGLEQKIDQALEETMQVRAELVAGSRA